MPVVNRNGRQRCQGPQINLLSDRLTGIIRPRPHQRREVLYFRDCISRQQNLAQFLQVQPAIRSFSKRAIIKVEAVYIDIRFYGGPPPAQICKSRPEAASRPTTEAAGGIWLIYIAQFSSKVNRFGRENPHSRARLSPRRPCPPNRVNSTNLKSSGLKYDPLKPHATVGGRRPVNPVSLI